jgi:hypothetical protein
MGAVTCFVCSPKRLCRIFLLPWNTLRELRPKRRGGKKTRRGVYERRILLSLDFNRNTTFMQILLLSVRPFRVGRRSISHIFATRLSLWVCAADVHGVKMLQIEAQRKVVPVHMRVEIELHVFLTLALGAGECTVSLPSRFNPGECTVVPIEYEAPETPKLCQWGWLDLNNCGLRLVGLRSD